MAWLTHGPVSIQRWLATLFVIVTLTALIFVGSDLYAGFSNVLQRDTPIL